MPIKKAAFKALRQSKKRAAHNKQTKDTLKKSIKTSRRLAEAKKMEEAKTSVLKSIKLLDRAVAKGVIKKNTAARTKSRLMKRLNVLMKK
jgi:small subunit ribosomal protein S20